MLKHEKSASHKESVAKEAPSSTRQIAAVNPPIPRRGIEMAFSCLYILAKQKIAHTTNFEPILDFCGFLGVEIKKMIRTAKNATYTSASAIQEMLFVLSDVIEADILSQMKTADHFAILFDETTDCTVTEQLAIHGRFINKDSGELQSHYLTVIDVLHPSDVTDREDNSSVVISLNAETITKKILQYAEAAQLNLKKLRGIATDGAATMTGCRNGVVARLKALTPSAIGVHCASHKLNLASSQAGDAVPYVKKFNNIVRQLYDYFENSPVRTAV